MKRDKKLFCYGCAHCAANAKFPSGPSGERPCCFCIRNPKLEKEPKIKTWYNGSEPVKVPMDCYMSLDMSRQVDQWVQIPTGIYRRIDWSG